ncbi:MULTISPECIES: GLPGLI family protein [Epilithonimonas]|uniref:GLPGLI family protein n=1 Tax=Epilithonimonas hominis TaxID=420404 RepID=A0A3N0X924_9FLAO|nr:MULTISPECIES: GLPGLI family protein [Epilithonimonas]ROI13862.1 GLPGLI family protein [Epilithonimonas hominis]
MLKYITFSTLFFFLNLMKIEAQRKNEVIIKTFYEANYETSLQKDSTNVNSKVLDIGSLYIGDEISVFQSAGKIQQDSMWANLNYIPGTVLNYSDYKSAKFDFTVIKKSGSNTLRFQEALIGGSLVGYDEKLKLMDWKILPETKKISNYSCKKAICNFRGRNYTAWFTEEIPFQDGPYKFNGLPGLIVKIYDEKNYFSFELVSFLKKQRTIILKNDLHTVENKKFYKTKIDRLNAVISNSPNVSIDQKRKPIIYNPIELFP